jgi:predicted GNAT superfamily acetyltransferase
VCHITRVLRGPPGIGDPWQAVPVPQLRPIETTDHADVLALNEANVLRLAPMDQDRLLQLVGWADRFDVVDVDGAFAGFVVTFAPGSPYDSENYRWFANRHGRDFYYLDRIVLAHGHRRRGLGTFVYDEVERVAAGYGRLALEVNLVPRNDVSLAFHDRRGYVEVGRLGDARHLQSLKEKRLS